MNAATAARTQEVVFLQMKNNALVGDDEHVGTQDAHKLMDEVGMTWAEMDM